MVHHEDRLVRVLLDRGGDLLVQPAELSEVVVLQLVAGSGNADEMVTVHHHMEIGAVPGDRFAGRADSLAALVIAVVVLRHHREQLCFVLQPARDRVFEGVKLFRIAVLCQIADHKHSVT